MSWNFRKSIKIAPGVKVTLGKKSTSVSVGPKGLKHSINTKGQVRRTTSIPGTGLYNSEVIGQVGADNGNEQNKKKGFFAALFGRK